MSKINTLNRSTIESTVRPALEAKLKELSDELGISITAANASFDPDGENATFKLNLAVVDGESARL